MTNFPSACFQLHYGQDFIPGDGSCVSRRTQVDNVSIASTLGGFPSKALLVFGGGKRKTVMHDEHAGSGGGGETPHSDA